MPSEQQHNNNQTPKMENLAIAPTPSPDAAQTENLDIAPNPDAAQTPSTQTENPHDLEFRSVKVRIDEFVNSGLAEQQITLRLPSQFRRRLYEYLDTYRAGTVYYQTETHPPLKVLCLSRTPKVAATDFFASHFCKLLQRSIPVPRAEYLRYYATLLNPYTNASADLEGFHQDCVKLGSLQELMSYIRTTISSIQEAMEPRVAGFRKQDFAEELASYVKPNALKHVSDIYSLANVGKEFISMDMNRANYTVLRLLLPSEFPWPSWNDVLLEFDTKETYTLKHSKFLREKLFGDLHNCGKTTKLAEFFVRQALEELKIQQSQIVHLRGDEVVLHYTPELFAEMQRFHNLTFKVLHFTLRGIGTRKYFVKEYGSNKEIKCIPKTMLCEGIKYYEGRDTQLEDRLFLTENERLAEFREPAIWE